MVFRHLNLLPFNTAEEIIQLNPFQERVNNNYNLHYNKTAILAKYIYNESTPQNDFQMRKRAKSLDSKISNGLKMGRNRDYKKLNKMLNVMDHQHNFLFTRNGLEVKRNSTR